MLCERNFFMSETSELLVFNIKASKYRNVIMGINITEFQLALNE